MYTKSIRTILFLFILLITACNSQPSNKKELSQIEALNEKLESLTQALHNNISNNQEERAENIKLAKMLEWRIDSIEKTQKLNDSLNAYYRFKEETIRDSIRILQREKDSLNAIRDEYQTNAHVDNTIESLTKAIAQKDLLIAQQNERNHLNSLSRDSVEKAIQKEINLNNPELKAMQANIITQMNYCILTSYYIKNSPSLDFFENKKHEMNNDLTVEPIKGVKEIQEYRQKIRETLDELIINEHEKQIYFDVLDIEKKNKKLNAAKNALQGDLLFVNPFSAIANTVLTIARAGIDLAVSKNEADIQNIRSMWVFQREYLMNEFKLVHEGFDYIHLLYDKYDLKEYDRLTERHIENYFSALSEPDPEARSRRLEYDSLVFKNMHDYYYYLGMSYIEADSTEIGYKRAEPYFDRYIKQYNEYPLFQIDDKTGIIALTRLLRGSKNTSNAYKTILIEEIEKNLPNNEIGYAVGAMEYYAMKEYEKSFRLLQKGIDKIENDEVLIEIALKYMNDIRKYPEIYHDICGAILSSKSLSLQQYAACVIEMDNSSRNQRLEELLELSNNDSLSLYLNKKQSKDIKHTALLNKTFVEKDVQLYNEIITNTGVYVYEYDMRPFGVSREELFRNAELLNKNTEIIPIFFEEANLEGEQTYFIRKPFDKTSFNKGGDKYFLINGRLNTTDYTYSQNDSLWNILIKYCAKLSTHREELLFNNLHKEKINSIKTLISTCDRNLKFLTDSTKTLEEKSRTFKYQADSIKNVEKKILTQIETIKGQINDLNIRNSTLDVHIEHLDSANIVQKILIKWLGWYEESQEYDKNKKAIVLLESHLHSTEQAHEKILYEYKLAKDNCVRIETEHNGININTLTQQKANLEEELSNLYVKKDNVYIYGNTPKYVRRANMGNGDYLKVILGEDNGSFGKIVLTYKRDGNKWLFYASEMIDGSKYRLAQ